MNEVAKQRVNLIIEYIEQILSDPLRVSAKIEISINDDYCTLGIIVQQNGFERHFNLIEKEYDYLIYEYLFKEIFERLNTSSFIGIGPLCRIRPSMSMSNSGTGIRLFNLNGSSLILDFIYMTKEGSRVFNEQGDVYNKRIEECIGRELTFQDIVGSYMNIEMNIVSENDNKSSINKNR